MALIVFYNLGNYVEAKFKRCDNTDTYHILLQFNECFRFF